MVRSLESIRAAAVQAKLSAAAVARACDPPLPSVTVWRVLKGHRDGNSATVERISAALDRLLPVAPQPTAAATAGEA